MKINDGVYMLEIHLKRIKNDCILNLTVLYDNNSVVLIDTGLPHSLDSIRESFEKDKIPFDKLKSIILTHQDIDHVGSISDILNETNKNIEILAHSAEEPYINGEKKAIKLVKFENNLKNLPLKSKIMCEALKAGFEKNRVNIDKTLTDCERLPYLGGVTVIYTPGHTPGHISLYIEKSKTLIAGDILMVKDNTLIKANDDINYDNELNMQSLKKLMKYDIETVICYHGGIYNKNVNACIKELCGEE